MKSERVFGLIASGIAVFYVIASFQIKASTITDPVGPRGFPIAVGIVMLVSAMFMVIRPDDYVVWPQARTLKSLAFILVVLVAYALSLNPLGFIIPTAIVSALLSYQITPNVKKAILSGCGLSIGVFLIFKYMLGLGLVAFPSHLMGA